MTIIPERAAHGYKQSDCFRLRDFIEDAPIVVFGLVGPRVEIGMKHMATDSNGRSMLRGSVPVLTHRS